MIKKIIVLGLAILVSIIGWIYTGIYAFGSQGTYYGFISCAQKEKLNYFHQFLIFEVVLFVILLLLRLKFIFLPLKNRILLYSTTAFMLINLLYIAYTVIDYPIINRSYSFLSASGEDTFKNPLFAISFMHALIFTAFLFTFHKNTMSLKLRFTLFTIALSTIIAETIIILSAKITPCFG